MISHKQKEYMYSYIKATPPQLQMHMHNYYEFLYFKSGDASYLVEDSIYPVENGDIFITRPGEFHAPVFHSDKSYERDFMQLSKDFIKEFPELFTKLDSRLPGHNNRIPAKIAKRYGLYEYFDNIKSHIVMPVPESKAMIKSYFIQFLVKLNNIDPKALQEAPEVKNQIDDIIDFLTNNISSDITLDFLSEKFFINKYYMCHSFKEKTGLTIKEFMNTRKITKAKHLLYDGADIMSICFECGFNDYSTFYKTFKKLTGKSPRAFFREHN